MVDEQITQTAQQIAEAQQQAEQAKAVQEQQQRQLDLARNQANSQQALRSGGLSGNLQRQNVIRQIDQSQINLNQKKQELQNYQSQINQAQQQFDEYKAQESAYELWKDQVPYSSLQGKPEYKYLKELWQNQGNYEAYNEERLKSKQELIAFADKANELGISFKDALKYGITTDELGQGVSTILIKQRDQGINSDVNRPTSQNDIKVKIPKIDITTVEAQTVPSASAMSLISTDLNKTDGSLNYGLVSTGISAGNDSGTRVGVSGNLRSGNPISDFLSGFSLGSKETAQKDLNKTDLIRLPSGSLFNITSGKYFNIATAGEPKTVLSNVKENIGQAVGNQNPTQLFRAAVGSQRPEYDKLSPGNFAIDVLSAPLRASETIGRSTTQLINLAGKSSGLSDKTSYILVPEQDITIPQRVTSSGEFKINLPETRSNVVENVANIGGFAASTASLLPFGVYAGVGMIAGGGETALNRNLPTEVRLSGAGEALLGGLWIGGTAANRLMRSEVKVLEPARTSTPEFREYQKTIYDPLTNEPVKVGKYIITTDTTPPVIRIENKLFTLYEGLGGKPQTYKAFTPYWTQIDEAVNVISFRKGAKYGTLYNVDGDATTTISEKLFRIKPDKSELSWISPGNRISRSRTISFYGEPNVIDNVRVTPFTIGYQDVSLPSIRKLTPKQSASLEFDEIMNNLVGRKVNYGQYIKDVPKKSIDSVKGFIFEEIPVSESRGFDIFSGSTAKSSDAYFKNLYQTTKQQTKLLPKVLPSYPKPKVSSSINKAVDAYNKNLQTGANNIGLASSAYYGTGQYEITESPVGPLVVAPVSKQSTTYLTNDSQIQQNSTMLIQATSNSLALDYGLDNRQQFKTPQMFKYNQDVNSLSKSDSKIDEAYGLSTKSTQSQSNQYRINANLINSQRPRLLPPRPRPATPFRLKFPSRDDSEKVFRYRDKVRKRGLGFIPYGRRKGKLIPLAGPQSTPERAEKLVKDFAINTLGASGKVKDTSGRPVALKTDRLFRYGSKGKDPFTIVQKTSQEGGSPYGRLASFGERREIRQAKLSKKIKRLYGI